MSYLSCHNMLFLYFSQKTKPWQPKINTRNLIGARGNEISLVTNSLIRCTFPRVMGFLQEMRRRAARVVSAPGVWWRGVGGGSNYLPPPPPTTTIAIRTLSQVPEVCSLTTYIHFSKSLNQRFYLISH